MNSVSTPLSSSRSSLPPPPLCLGFIQVQFSGELVKVNFVSRVRDTFLHTVFLILKMCHQNTVPICSPCYFLPLFCIKEVNLEFFTVSDSVRLAMFWSTKSRTEWLGYLKFQLRIALNKKQWLPCVWHSTSVLSLDLHLKFNHVVAAA